MFRIGIVKAQDLQNCRVRVVFPDHDQLQSWWLPIVVPKSQNDKFYWIPDIGEQVVCLMDERDEDGAVLGAIYSAADLTPMQSADTFNLSVKDGTSFAYNRVSHALQVNIPNGGSMIITVSGANVTIDALGNVKITAAGLIQLGGGALKGVARLGDTVTCPAGTGTITSSSINVLSE